MRSTGTLRADEGVELQAETNGRIVAISFTEGARVRKGDLLVKLNDADLVATRARAELRKSSRRLKSAASLNCSSRASHARKSTTTALNDLHVQEAGNRTDRYAASAKTEVRARRSMASSVLRYDQRGRLRDRRDACRYVAGGSIGSGSTISVPEKAMPRAYAWAVPIQLIVAGQIVASTGRSTAIDPRSRFGDSHHVAHPRGVPQQGGEAVSRRVRQRLADTR